MKIIKQFLKNKKIIRFLEVVVPFLSSLLGIIIGIGLLKNEWHWDWLILMPKDITLDFLYWVLLIEVSTSMVYRYKRKK